jgi:chemotaxis protein MotB
MVMSGSRSFMVLVTAGMAVGALGLGGCVSQDQYDRLESAYTQARAQMAEEQHDLDALRREMARVKAELAEKENLANLEGSGAQAQRAMVDALKARLAKLQDQYNKLLALAGQAPQLPRSVNMALQRLAAKYPDLLAFDSKSGLVRFKSDLTFDLGSTTVKPEARHALGQFASILNMPVIADNEIRIVGNTDNVPVRHTTRNVMNPSNWILSTNRANAVRAVLQHDGINPARLQPAGWGRYHPIAPNKPHRRGNALNRRVDIYILPRKVSNSFLGGGQGGGGAGGGNGFRPVRHRHHNQGFGTGTGAGPTGGNGGGGTVPVPTPQ